MLASMTGLGRGIPAVNLDKSSSVPVGFVFQLADKLAPSYITDGLCQRVVLDHILDRQAHFSAHRSDRTGICRPAWSSCSRTIGPFAVS